MGEGLASESDSAPGVYRLGYITLYIAHLFIPILYFFENFNNFLTQIADGFHKYVKNVCVRINVPLSVYYLELDPVLWTVLLH